MKPNGMRKGSIVLRSKPGRPIMMDIGEHRLKSMADGCL